MAKARKEMATYFTLNTGARIPSVGLGTYKAGPGVVGDLIAAAVKVLSTPPSRFCSELYYIRVLFRVCFAHKLALRACCLSA